MMKRELTTYERFSRMFAHREADRVPIIDGPWGSTVERWRREGMPEEVSYVDFFGLDHVAGIGADNSPRYPEKTLEETDEYVVRTSKWGATLKNWKHATSTPEFVDFTIKDRASWAAAKARMTPARDRVDWARLKKNYADWRKKGYWVEAGLWFGFDVTHAWAVGTERLLAAMAEDPEWCVEMFNHYLDVQLALFDQVWQEGYRFDSVRWPDDMGYKGHQFFSVRMYRDLLKPVHKRAVDWAHAKGVYAHLHSCGDVNPLVPELLDIGLDALNPLEVKAGMDPVALKRKCGDRLLLHGGINAVLWDNTEAISAEIRRVLPVVKERGGYIFSSDHSIPSSVSLKDFRRIVALAKKEGAY
jgi:uroporphyrinogen decarboxylase